MNSMADRSTDITQLLIDVAGDPARVKADLLMPVVFDELKSLAKALLRSERSGHTLQPTALVNEAYIRLIDQSRVDWQGRTHFRAIAAGAMRRILIDYGRARGRQKRGGGWQRVLLDEAAAWQDMNDLDALALKDALERLASLDAQQAKIVELRFFGGLTVEEAARVLGVSKRKVEADWTHAKAWLRDALDPGPSR